MRLRRLARRHTTAQGGGDARSGGALGIGWVKVDLDARSGVIGRMCLSMSSNGPTF